MPTTKPLPRKQRVINRGLLYTRTKDDVKNPKVTLLDIDTSINFYFNSVIKPSVEDNGENVKVPLMYASPERWKSIQQDGFMRDKKDQIITPVIVYKRTSVEKDDSLPQDKLDANNPNLFYTFEISPSCTGYLVFLQHLHILALYTFVILCTVYNCEDGGNGLVSPLNIYNQTPLSSQLYPTLIALLSSPDAYHLSFFPKEYI